MREELVVISFKLPKSMLNNLDAIAFRLGVNRSELIRFAITQLLESKGKEILTHTKKITVRRHVLT